LYDFSSTPTMRLTTGNKDEEKVLHFCLIH
jgi:hypothetical protein